MYPRWEASDHLFRNSPDSFRSMDVVGIRREKAETSVT